MDSHAHPENYEIIMHNRENLAVAFPYRLEKQLLSKVPKDSLVAGIDS